MGVAAVRSNCPTDHATQTLQSSEVTRSASAVLLADLQILTRDLLADVPEVTITTDDGTLRVERRLFDNSYRYVQVSATTFDETSDQTLSEMFAKMPFQMLWGAFRSSDDFDARQLGSAKHMLHIIEIYIKDLQDWTVVRNEDVFDEN